MSFIIMGDKLCGITGFWGKTNDSRSSSSCAADEIFFQKGLQTPEFSLLMGAASLPTERAGDGVESRPELYPPSEEGDIGRRDIIGEAAEAEEEMVLTERGVDGGDEESTSLTLEPRWDMRPVPNWRLTPGTVERNLETSLAQAVKPALYLSTSMAGLVWSICCLLSFWRWRTAISRTSAFSSLVMASPSIWRASTMRSLMSSRHLLILALLFLSSRGFMTFLYWCVLDIGWSAIGSTGMWRTASKLKAVTGAMLLLWLLS